MNELVGYRDLVWEWIPLGRPRWPFFHGHTPWESVITYPGKQSSIKMFGDRNNKSFDRL